MQIEFENNVRQGDAAVARQLQVHRGRVADAGVGANTAVAQAPAVTKTCDAQLLSNNGTGKWVPHGCFRGTLPISAEAGRVSHQ